MEGEQPGGIRHRAVVALVLEETGRDDLALLGDRDGVRDGGRPALGRHLAGRRVVAVDLFVFLGSEQRHILAILGRNRGQLLGLREQASQLRASLVGVRQIDGA